MDVDLDLSGVIFFCCPSSCLLLLLLLFTVLFGYRLLMLTPDVFSLISFFNHNWL